LFRGVGVWNVGHGRREATSDRLLASMERPVTIIPPLTIGLPVNGKKPKKTGFGKPVTGSEK